jgi:hypothetical protein
MTTAAAAAAAQAGVATTTAVDNMARAALAVWMQLRVVIVMARPSCESTDGVRGHHEDRAQGTVANQSFAYVHARRVLRRRGRSLTSPVTPLAGGETLSVPVVRVAGTNGLE